MTDENKDNDDDIVRLRSWAKNQRRFRDEEILEDKYPLLLINGKILAQEVNEIVHELRYKNVKEYLEDIDKEYEGAIKFRDPEEILLD